MIVTKPELSQILAANFAGTIINNKSLYEKFITVLDWKDDEPRDITPGDIELAEDLIADELDRLLTLLEGQCFKES